jgi:hypothetical protein
LKDIDVNWIERKPEAPWIVREMNSIKFTEEIRNFSRLEVNYSEISKEEGEKC